MTAAPELVPAIAAEVVADTVAAADAIARKAERISTASSADWDGLSAILGDSDDEEGTLPAASGPSSPQQEPHMAQIESRDFLSHADFSADFRTSSKGASHTDLSGMRAYASMAACASICARTCWTTLAFASTC